MAFFFRTQTEQSPFLASSDATHNAFGSKSKKAKQLAFSCDSHVNTGFSSTESSCHQKQL